MPPELQCCKAQRDRRCMSFAEMVLVRPFQSGVFLFCKIQFRLPPSSPAYKITESKIKQRGSRKGKKKKKNPQIHLFPFFSYNFPSVWAFLDGIILLISKVIKTISWICLVFWCFQGKFGSHLWVPLAVPGTEYVGWGKQHGNDSTPWSEAKLIIEES